MSVKPNEKGKRDRGEMTSYPGETREVNTPLTVLMRHRWQLLTCLLIVCIVAFLATKFRQIKYESAARIQILSGPPKLSGIAGLAGAQDDFFNTQCQLLQSRHVLSRALENLHKADPQWCLTEEAIHDLQSSIQVQPLGGSRLVDIVAASNNPAKAAAIANEITAAFIASADENSRAQVTQMLECVNQQVANCDQEISKLTEQLKTFRQQYLITGNDSELAAVEGRITLLEQQLSKNAMDKIKLENQLEKYRQILANGRGLEDAELSLKEINSDASVVILRNKISSLRENESALVRIYLPGHELLRSIRFEIEDAENQMRAQKYSLLGRFLSEAQESLASIAAEEKTIKTNLETTRLKGVDLANRNVQYTALLSSLQNAQRLRDKYMMDAQQYRLEKGVHATTVKLVEAARVPLKPSGLSKEHQAASILLLGILFSITLVFVADRFSRNEPEGEDSYYHPMYIPVPCESWDMASDRQRPWGVRGSASLPLACIGQMQLGGASTDDMAFSARSRIVCSDQRSNEAASFRSLSAKLLNRYGPAHQSLVITSTQEGAGKTTCACNLALVLAQAGRRVLLVDANAEAPALDRIFKLNDEQPGLTDVLANLPLWERSCQTSDAANLDILPYGDRRAEQAVMTSRNFGALNNELIAAYEWVIYDAGCLDADATQNLLQGIGRAIAICTSERSSSSILEQIEQCGATALGYIENVFDNAEYRSPRRRASAHTRV